MLCLIIYLWIVYIVINIMDALGNISSLLTSWGMDDLIQQFQEEGITSDIFSNLLEENHLEKLVPSPLGKRLKLKNKIVEFLNQSNSKLENSMEDVIHFNEIPNEPSTSNLETSTFIFDLVPSDHESMCSLPSATQSTPLREDNFDEPALKKMKSNINQFNLEDLLNSTAIGRALLNWYKIKGGFDSTRQGYLVEIISSYFLNSKHIHLNNSDYSVIATKIIDLFPCEIKEAYFIPPLKKKDSRDKKSGVAKGKLVDKFRNKLTFLREAGLLPSRNEEKENELVSADKANLKDNVRDSLLWLENNKEPWSKLQKHWDDTFLARRQLILNEKVSMDDIYQQFIILKEPQAPILVINDFGKIFPNKVKKLYTEFETVVFKLIEIRKQYVTTETDKILIDLLNNKEVPKDYLHYVMFSLLPSLLPCKSKFITKNKQQWKPKIVDSREGIVLRAEFAGDVETLIENKKVKLLSLDLPLHPFIIVVGNGLQVEKVYIFCNNILYPMETILKAIDCCFMWYHVFNLQYQSEAEHIWTFIQHAMYDLRTKWDKPIPTILDIVNKLRH